jgi:glycosyltransferase involved in cell wall biosynthesis
MLSRRPRLGFYCPGTGTGGPWRYLHSILAGLDHTEFEAAVFCDLPGVYEPRPWVQVVGLTEPQTAPGENLSAGSSSAAVHPKPVSTVRSWVPKSVRMLAGFRKEALLLARLFRAHPVDLLHTQLTGCEVSSIAAKWAGLRTVIGTFHVDSTYDLYRERNGLTHRSLEVVSNQCLDVAIAVSHDTKRDWVRRTRMAARRVVPIHNGIDTERFRRRHPRAEARQHLGLPTDALIVGGLGRLDEAKGFTYLIDAAAALAAEFPSLMVVIAGQGELRKSLEAQAERLGIGQRVRFLGFMSDVQMVLDAVDVFAFPSVCETLGYALLEAMATELPAVGARVGGIPEVIVDGQTGLIVPPRRPDRLAVALAQLLRSEHTRRDFGIAGRNRVSRYFREDDMVRRTVALYRRMS